MGVQRTINIIMHRMAVVFILVWYAIMIIIFGASAVHDLRELLNEALEAMEERHVHKSNGSGV